MCKALKFPRSTYYKALVCEASNKRKEHQEFSAKVKQCFENNKRRYGAVKICKKLNDSGILCSIKRVQRHMKNQGLRSVVTKRYNHKSNCGNIPSDKENILNRNFEATTINQKWVTDITYIYVKSEGWTYLASVMDLYSRKIIGYAYGKNMTAGLALEAVKNACLNVKKTTGIILHSDLGSQYTCTLFENYMKEKRFLHSFSRKGNPYDNAPMERYFNTLKNEEIYLHHYHEEQELYDAVEDFAYVKYNHVRPHAYNRYRTPFEARYAV